MGNESNPMGLHLPGGPGWPPAKGEAHWQAGRPLSFPPRHGPSVRLLGAALGPPAEQRERSPACRRNHGSRPSCRRCHHPSPSREMYHAAVTHSQPVSYLVPGSPIRLPAIKRQKVWGPTPQASLLPSGRTELFGTLIVSVPLQSCKWPHLPPTGPQVWAPVFCKMDPTALSPTLPDMLAVGKPQGRLAYPFVTETETGAAEAALGDQRGHQGPGLEDQSQAHTVNLSSARTTRTCPRVASFSTSRSAMKTT